MKTSILISLIFASISIFGQKVSIDSQDNINMLVLMYEGLVFENGETITIANQYHSNENVLFQLNSNGELNWYVQFEPNEYSDVFQVFDINTDYENNICILAEFYGNISFNDTILNGENGNTFIIKFDQLGNILWIKQSTGNAIHSEMNLSFDELNNIYFTGNFTSDFTFGNNETLTSSNYDSNIYIAKFNKNGNNEWLKHLTGGGVDYVFDIATDKIGNNFIIGEYSGTLYFEGFIISSISSWDIFVASCDDSGNPTSLISIGGDDHDMGIKITANKNSVSFSTSSYSSFININDTIQIYPNPPPGFLKSTIVFNFNNSLDTLNWYLELDSLSQQYQQISFDNNENTRFQGISAFGDRLDSYKINNSGNIDCQHRILGHSLENDLVVKNIYSYICGTFYNSIDFGNNNIFLGDNINYYIAKFNNICDLIWVNIIENHYTNIDEVNNNIKIKLFPNPASSIINIQIDEISANTKISLTDILGRQVFNKTYNENIISINISNLNSGLYIVEIWIDELKVFNKIIIRK